MPMWSKDKVSLKVVIIDSLYNFSTVCFLEFVSADIYQSQLKNTVSQENKVEGIY